MTLKMKLTSLIASFTLVIGLMLMGVFAVNQATVNMGGSINFTATDVYARVTGKIENAQGEYADKELPPLEFSAENGTPDQSEWSGLNLLFDDDATPIVITVTVENLAKDRKLTASLTDNTAINENLVKDLKQDGVTYTSGTTKDLDASTGDGTSTTTYVVTFSIADHNKSLPQMDFKLDIDLMDEGYEPPPEVLEGFVFDNGVLTEYNGTETDIVIPESYSIISTESEEIERNFSLDIVPDLAQTLTEIAIFSNWNYTDASGKSGVITYADMMGSGEDLQSLVFPLQVELDYKVTYSEYSETNLQMIQTFMTSFEELTSQGYISGGFYATVGENAKTYYANTADFDVDYPDISSAFPITLELENPISIDMYKNIKSFTFDPNAESDPDALADLEMYLAMLPISTWNYTDAKGNKGTLTAADFMGLTDNVTPISYPIDIEVTYNTTIPTATDENLESCMQLFSNYMQAFEEMKSAGNITGGFYATVGENGEKILYANIDDFSAFLSANYPDDQSVLNAFPMTFELENPVIIPGEQIFVEGNDIEVIGIDDATSSNNGVFYDSEITSIKLPSTLEFIGAYAFYNCEKLANVEFPTSLTRIGNSAFYNCSGFTSITIPKMVSSIGFNAFCNCYYVSEINFNAIYIGDFDSDNYTFGGIGRSTGTVLNFGEGVEHIPANLFNYNLTRHSVNIKSVNFPASVSSIGSSAFKYCSSLNNINFSSNLEIIGNDAFYRCSGLTSLDLSSCTRLKTIGSGSFHACSGLTEIDLRNCTSLEVIEGGVFYNCDGLTEVDLSNCTSLTSIGAQAFRGCSELTNIELPSSLTSLENAVFMDCNNLQPSVIDLGVQYLGNSENPYSVLWDGHDITVSTYIVNEKCKVIGSGAFSLCSWLTNITLPTGLAGIGGSAFSGCSGLKTVNLGDCTSLESISYNAFDDCSGLTGELVIPEGVKSIEGYAFSGCAFTSIILPSSLETIGEAALPTTLQPSATDQEVKYLGNSENPYLVLWNGRDITTSTYKVNENCKIIYYRAFHSCSGLTEVDLSQSTSLTSIGSRAFSGCYTLSSITLPSSLTNIDRMAFQYCGGLTSVTINEYVFRTVTSLEGSCGYLLNNLSNGETVLVPANLIDDLHLTNSYLDDTSEFTRSETANEDGYYVYTKK